MIAYLPVAAANGIALFGLIWGIVWGVVCYRMFERAGKPNWVGFILGFLLGLIGVLIAWLVTRNSKPSPAAPAGGASFCASCGQAIS